MGEERRGDGREPHGEPHLGEAIGLVGVVEGALDGGGLLHHGVGQGASRTEVGRHDGVSTFGSPLNGLQGGYRLHADPQESHPQVVGHLADLLPVPGELDRHGMEVGGGRASELVLPAGLQGNGRTVPRESDHSPVFHRGLPAVLLGHGGEGGLNAPRAAEGHSLGGGWVDTNLLKLQTGEPLRRWLAPRSECENQLICALYGDVFGLHRATGLL